MNTAQFFAPAWTALLLASVAASASIAALQHIEKHGNSNVLEPLYRATLAWRNKRMSNAWVAWVVSYSWFIFNPRNLKGQALTKAKEEGFHSLWVKSKGKEMNIDGAKGEPWYEAKPEAKADKPEAKADAKPAAKAVETDDGADEASDSDPSALLAASAAARISWMRTSSM